MLKPVSTTAGQDQDAGAAQPAVAAGVLRQVLLVVVLGVVEGGRRGDLGGDRPVAVPSQLGLEARAAGLGGGQLGGVRAVDGRTVLGADVVALAHALLV